MTWKYFTLPQNPITCTDPTLSKFVKPVLQ